MNPLNYLKAIVGAVAAGLGAAYLGLDDGSLTPQEWAMIAQTTLAAFATVWGIPNKSASTVSDPTPVTIVSPTLKQAQEQVSTGAIPATPAPSVVIDLDGR